MNTLLLFVIAIVVGGAMLFVATVLFLVLFIPLAAALNNVLKLSNDPQDPEKWHLFTTVEQIQIKAIVRGKHVVGYIMYSPDLVLQRNRNDSAYTIETPEFAEVIDRRRTNGDTHKGNDLMYWSHWSVGWIRRFVYHQFGLIWVGIPPFQQVYQPPFDSKHLTTKVVEGKVVRDIVTTTSVTHTDHLRVGEFDRPFAVLDIDLQGNLKVSVWGEATYQVTNAFSAFWKVTRFELRIDNLVSKCLNDYLSTMQITDILTRKEHHNKDTEDHMLGVLQATLGDWGIRIKRFHIVEVSDAMTGKQQEALTAKWVAEQSKEARKQEAEGEAAFLEHIGTKLAANPVLAQAYREIEVAKAASKGQGTSTIILGGGQSQNLDPVLLAELQRLVNEAKRGRT